MKTKRGFLLIGILLLIILPSIYAISIINVTDYPDPVEQGNNINFDLYWAEQNDSHIFTDDFNYGTPDNPINHEWDSCEGNCYTYNFEGDWVFAFETYNSSDREILAKNINPTTTDNLEINFNLEARTLNDSVFESVALNTWNSSILIFWLTETGNEFGYWNSTPMFTSCGTFNIGEDNKYTIKNLNLDTQIAELYQNDDFKCDMEFNTPLTSIKDLTSVKFSHTANANEVFYLDDVNIQWIEQENISTVDMDICGTINFNNETGICTDETLCHNEDQLSIASCIYNATIPENPYNYYGYACYKQVINIEEPSVLWNISFDGGDEDFCNDIIETSDNNYVLIGQTYSYGANIQDWWFQKLNNTGGSIFRQNIGGSDSAFDSGYSVIETSDNNYLLFGRLSNYKFIVKTNSNGVQLWNKSYGNFAYSFTSDVVESYDNNYLFGGSEYDSNSSSVLLHLLKTDTNGNVIINKTYGDITKNTYSSALIENSNNDILLLGYHPNGTTNNYYLFKTDSSGNHLWNKTIWGINTTSVIYTSMIETSDNNYLIVGFDGSTSPYFIRFTKLDGNGDIIFDKIINTVFQDYAYSVIEDYDNNYLIFGSTGSLVTASYDMWLIKTDTDGNIISNTTYTKGDLYYDDYGKSIKKTSDDGYILCGDSRLSGGGNDYNIWVLKLSQEEIISQTLCSDYYQGNFTVYSENITFLCGNHEWDDDEQCEFDEDGNIIWGGDWDRRDCTYHDECTGGNLSCNPSNCQPDGSQCTGCVIGGFCGNSIVEYPNSDSFYEDCDLSNLDSKNCEGFQGFDAGYLTCKDNCKFNLSDCYQAKDIPLDLCPYLCGDTICTPTSPCFETFDTCPADCLSPDEVSCIGEEICIPSHLVDVKNMDDPDKMTKGLLPTIYYGMIGFFNSTYTPIFGLIAGIVVFLIIGLFTAFIVKLLSQKWK